MAIFTTTAGVEIPIQPISLLDLQLAQNAVREQFIAEGKPIEPPKYQVEVLGGEVEYHDHTAKTIQDGTEEEKEAWQNYLNALEELETEVQKRTALVFLEGIKINLPEDDSWIARRKKIFNETVPDDPDEKLLHYINNVLLKTPHDKNGLMLEIQKLSMTGATPEAIEAFEDLFRSQMENAQRQATQDLKAQLKKQENVVLQSDTEGRLDSEGVGDVPFPISQPANGRSGGDDSDSPDRIKEDGMGSIPGPIESGRGEAKTETEA